MRFSHRLGLGHPQLHVMQDRGLVEKPAAPAGLGAVKATFTAPGNPTATNDALPSDRTEVSYGSGPRRILPIGDLMARTGS